MWFKLSGYFRTKGFQEKHVKNFTAFLQQEQETAPFLDEMEIREMDMQYEALMEVINHTIANMPDKMREVITPNFAVASVHNI